MSAPRRGQVSSLVMMGVAGSGKTTVGRKLAEQLGWSFFDADDFHSQESIAKMGAGEPLDDDDRQPWLERIRGVLDEQRERRRGTVLACSALKERYRQTLGISREGVGLVHLTGTKQLLAERLEHRAGHFAGVALLDSQLATLEAPASGDALTLDVVHAPAELCLDIRRHFGLMPTPSAG